MFKFLKKFNRQLFFTFLLISSVAFIFSHKQLKGIEVLPDLPKLGSLKQSPDANRNPIIRLVDQDEVTKVNQFHCTAVVFDTRYAVTAAHCLNDDDGFLRKKVFAIFDEDGNDTNIRAYPAGINNRMDVGILMGDFSSFLMAKVSVYETPLYTARGPFITCGYPYGQKYMTCNPFYPKSNSFFHVIGVGALFPGMSGGPVIDLSNQVVVGVNSSVSDGFVTVVPLTGLVGAFKLEP